FTCMLAPLLQQIPFDFNHRSACTRGSSGEIEEKMEPRETIAIVPAFQASATVATVVATLAEVGVPAIVVDDGSTDATAAEAARAGARVLRHERNLGYSEAVRTGLNVAVDQGFDTAVTFDADGAHLANDVP